jgi:hypothetical protein
VVCSSQIHRYSPLQHLAMAVWMRKWPDGVMAMITAYFDASGCPNDTVAVSLGGLVSTAEKWIAFSDQWQECLDAFGVSSLHMKHFAHSTGEFSSWKNDEPKRRRFLSGLMYAIENHVEYSVASTVLMKDYRAIDKKYCLSGFMRPYTFAASTCVGSIIPWAAKSGYPADEIAYIFEKGDTDQADVVRCWESQFPSYRLSPIFLRKTDKQPGSEVCTPIRPFEAADLIAYENLRANKTIEIQGGDIFFDELRKPIQRLFNLPGAREWRRADLGEMEAICSRFRVAERPPST